MGDFCEIRGTHPVLHENIFLESRAPFRISPPTIGRRCIKITQNHDLVPILSGLLYYAVQGLPQMDARLLILGARHMLIDTNKVPGVR